MEIISLKRKKYLYFPSYYANLPIYPAARAAKIVKKALDISGRGIYSPLGLIYSGAALAAMLAFAAPCAMLFLDPQEAELTLLVGLTRQYIVTLTVFFFPLAPVNILRFSIQGMGISTLAILAGVLEMLARTVVGRWFVPGLGFDAACFASPMAWICADLFLIPACVLCIARLRRRERTAEQLEPRPLPRGGERTAEQAQTRPLPRRRAAAASH